MAFTYIVANSKFFSYLTGGTSFNNLDTAISNGNILGTTNDSDYDGFIGSIYMVTGSSLSRLMELKKYVINAPFINQYVGSGNTKNDGVDFLHSTDNTIVYFLGSIQYVDILSGSTSGTTFNFVTSGVTNNPNFINIPIYKNSNKENIISNPKINNDVFITRQELSAFDKNYRLEYIRNLSDLETYAGGKFFNIINNT